MNNSKDGYFKIADDTNNKEAAYVKCKDNNCSIITNNEISEKPNSKCDKDVDEIFRVKMKKNVYETKICFKGNLLEFSQPGTKVNKLININNNNSKRGSDQVKILTITEDSINEMDISKCKIPVSF